MELEIDNQLSNWRLVTKGGAQGGKGWRLLLTRCTVRYCRWHGDAAAATGVLQPRQIALTADTEINRGSTITTQQAARR